MKGSDVITKKPVSYLTSFDEDSNADAESAAGSRRGTASTNNGMNGSLMSEGDQFGPLSESESEDEDEDEDEKEGKEEEEKEDPNEDPERKAIRLAKKLVPKVYV